MRLGRVLLGLGLATGLSIAAHADPVTDIWVNNADFGNPILQEYDIGTGALVQQITAPHGFNGRGVVVVGNVIYYTSSGTNAVYGYNYVTHTDLGTIFTVAGSSGLATMAYDGTNFWLGDYSGTNHVYEYTPTGTLLNTISLSKCSSYCDGLEYFNGKLISNERDGFDGPANKYDVYSLSGTLLTSDLITGHDPTGNTGIAFDGTDFYVDNINSATIDVFSQTGAYIRTITLTGQTYFLGEDLSFDYSQVIPPSVPEPASLAVFGVGLVGLGLMRRRRKG